MSIFPQFAQYEEANTKQAGGMSQFDGLRIDGGRQEQAIDPPAYFAFPQTKGAHGASQR